MHVRSASKNYHRGLEKTITINTRRTHERFCNKRANLGETVYFPALRYKAKSVFPILCSVEHDMCSVRNRGINECKF